MGHEMTEIAARGPIRVEFPTGEAFYALDALSVSSAEAWKRVRRMTETGAPVDEREIAETAAIMLDRAHKRLDGALFPVCRYLAEEDCERPFAGHDERGVPYCQIHLDHVRQIREATR